MVWFPLFNMFMQTLDKEERAALRDVWKRQADVQMAMMKTQAEAGAQKIQTGEKSGQMKSRWQKLCNQLTLPGPNILF